MDAVVLTRCYLDAADWTPNKYKCKCKLTILKFNISVKMSTKI